MHPWSRNIISDDIKQLSTFKEKSKVVKFATHKNSHNNTTSMAVVLESTKQEGLVELFFTPMLQINQDSCKTRWTKCNLAGSVNITRNFHVVLSENLYSDNGEVIILLAGQSQNSDFISGYVNCFSQDSGITRKWQQLPERGEKKILEVKTVYRQFDQGFYFLTKDNENSKEKIVYYDIDKWL